MHVMITESDIPYTCLEKAGREKKVLLYAKFKALFYAINLHTLLPRLPSRLIMGLKSREIISSPANLIIVRTASIKTFRKFQIDSAARLRVLKQAPIGSRTLNHGSMSVIPVLPLLRQIAIVIDGAGERAFASTRDGLFDIVECDTAYYRRDGDVEALAKTLF